MSTTKTGAELIADERARQIAEEEWSATHDDIGHKNGEIRDAAEAYLRELRYRVPRNGAIGKIPAAPWPWEDGSWKPTADPVRQLVKAGALIAAEIDRLQRLPRPPQQEEGRG